MSHKIRILLVDDYPMVNDGLKLCLETKDNLEVVDSVSDGKLALEALETLKPDIVIMDINMPNMDGLEALERMKAKQPGVKVIILSMHSSREYVTRAVRSGAKGYLLKDVPLDHVIAAIEATSRGATYFSEAASKFLFQRYDEPEANLSDREKEVLTLIAKGNSNKLIARNLDLSVRTAETHRRNIKRKLKLNSTAELTQYAISQGLIL